ncbi:MAG: putative transrane anti-sigma factor [Frankiales bacterium]|nr:putative transrane anti-sigma factor [Frankiales bacterium]
MSVHERFEELAVGHALNALEPEDEVTFLTHLRGCAACERAVADHRESLAHLAYATDSVEPPAALLTRIRAAVQESGTAGPFPAPVRLEPRRQRRTIRMTTAVVGVAASAVLVMALLISDVGLHFRNRDLQARGQAIQSAVTSLLSPGARRVELSGTGQAVAIVHGHQVDLVLAGLPVNDRNSVYVLWQQTASGRVTAAGTFDMHGGQVTVIHQGLNIGTDTQRLLVTREAGRTAPVSAAGPLLLSGTI